MNCVTQKTLRTLLPGKIARVVALISQEKNCSEKEALLDFYASDVYKKLENESTKCWRLSPEQLFEDLK